MPGEPIDLEAALRAARAAVMMAAEQSRQAFASWLKNDNAHRYRVQYNECEREHNRRLDQYEALARAVGALHDGGCCPAVDSCFDDVGVCHVHAYRDEAERLAREVLMHSERKAD